jgi:hypothetical protein
MHRVMTAISVTVAVTVAYLSTAPAEARRTARPATDPGNHDVLCSAWTCTAFVESSSASGSRGDTSKSRRNGALAKNAGTRIVGPQLPSRSDLCTSAPAAPQPPASHPVWNGHEPGTGVIYTRTCPMTKSTPISSMVWVPNGGDAAMAAPLVTPAELAERAMASVRVPRPVIQRSPDERSRDGNGLPYTWVHEWTWFWVQPGVWRQRSATAEAGGLWATVRIRPSRLTINPGTGDEEISCAGPGRAWTSADGDGPPSEGGCAFRYRQVTSTPLRVQASIEWSVTWIGSGGSGGDLPVMRTTTTSPLMVRQIQVVTR